MRDFFGKYRKMYTEKVFGKVGIIEENPRKRILVLDIGISHTKKKNKPSGMKQWRIIVHLKKEMLPLKNS